MFEITTATAGRVFAVDTAAADIVGFDPARDKLDLGEVSVHNFIVVDTPAGVGFMNPWSGETIVVQGVGLGQLTIDSFLPVTNDHLRQCLSGALAWEHGIAAAPNTVYARSHELGQIDKVAFNPATDVVDFRFYGTREQISLTDSAEGVVIANAGTGQALILLGVAKSALSVANFVFYAAEVREDRVHLQLGFTIVPDSQVLAQGVPVAGTTAWPTAAGPGQAPPGRDRHDIRHRLALRRQHRARLRPGGRQARFRLVQGNGILAAPRCPVRQSSPSRATSSPIRCPASGLANSR